MTDTPHKAEPTRAERTPMKPGYYWAKWRIASDGTHEGDELTPSDKWELVQVNENCLGWEGDPADDEALSVSVPGVRETQWRNCFVWGEFVAPIDKAALASCPAPYHEGKSPEPFPLAPDDTALKYARRLAVTLHDQLWALDSAGWKPLEDLIGLLTQIDNMTADLIRPAPAAEGAGEYIPIPIVEVEAEAQRLRDMSTDMRYAAYNALLFVLGYGVKPPSRLFQVDSPSAARPSVQDGMQAQLREIIAKFHRNSCYPQAMDVELYACVSQILAHLSKPFATSSSGRVTEEKVARAFETFCLMPMTTDWHDEKGPWCVVDASTAEPEVNWPGELVSKHTSKAEARLGRARAVLRLLTRTDEEISTIKKDAVYRTNDQQFDLFRMLDAVPRLIGEIEAARKALSEINRLVHAPTPHGTKAYTHFMRDFDQIRALCRPFLPIPEPKDAPSN